MSRVESCGRFNPLVIVEVLSPTTAAVDLSEKFQKSRAIPSRMDFVLISQPQPVVELFQRKDFNRWEATFVESVDTTMEIPVVQVGVRLHRLHQLVTVQGRS